MGLIFFKGPFLGAYIRGGGGGGLSMEPKEICVSKPIGLAWLTVRSKFTVFACFTLYLRTIFQVQAPEGLIFGGAI